MPRDAEFCEGLAMQPATYSNFDKLEVQTSLHLMERTVEVHPLPPLIPGPRQQTRVHYRTDPLNYIPAESPHSLS